MSACHQNAGQNHDMITNRMFENVAHFIYLRTTVTNQNLIQEGIKKRSNSGNALLPFSQESFVFLPAV
jgi:hypothetical protein